MKIFRDRSDAGRQLGEQLRRQPLKGRPIVLGLPRGGVPVAHEVAAALGAPLDVLIVRKIGAPGHEELGIGAVVDGDPPQLVVNERIADMVGASRAYIERQKARQLAEIARRKRAYRGDRPDPRVAGRTVIVVDDGIATGGTVKAALSALRAMKPARLVLAVPVAPADSLAELEPECDEIVCLVRPDFFVAIGGYYDDFTQIEDAEVIRLLAGAREP
ncbi:MAG: phosphoribosyltransferase [Lysobacterales bacterium]|nr:MAG: phosphoribosyltransferase [Xanthomonadales bacterium]